MSPPILAIYSPKLHTQLHCDAITHDYSAILLQKQTDSRLHPAFFYSQRTTVAKSKYHSFQLELLPIVNAIKQFHYYLKGILFTIITDCNCKIIFTEKRN